MIKCIKENCQQFYIGETGNKLKERTSQHIGYINNKNSKEATGEHFNSNGHNLYDMKVIGLEIVKKNDTEYRKERESYLIRKFNSFYKGINRMP